MIYQILSLLLLSIFYLTYLIKNCLLKKKNITVNQLGKNKKSKNIKHFEIILKIFTYLMVLVQVFSVLINDKWFIINNPPYFKIIGLFIMILSIIIFIITLLTMKNNWRVGISYDETTTLVTTGIYKISRNPAFLGFDLLYIGLSLIYPNPINILFSIVLIILFDIQIKYEEQSLIAKYGDEYKNYCEKVRRYFLFF